MLLVVAREAAKYPTKHRIDSNKKKKKTKKKKKKKKKKRIFIPNISIVLKLKNCSFSLCFMYTSLNRKLDFFSYLTVSVF